MMLALTIKGINLIRSRANLDLQRLTHWLDGQQHIANDKIKRPTKVYSYSKQRELS